MNLILEGGIVPKARPRFGNGHSYLPDRYRHWKIRAIESLREQWGDREPIDRCTVSIEIFGRQAGDLDNIAGAILDALVQAQILKDDRLSCVSGLTIVYDKTKDKQKTRIILSDCESLSVA